MPELKEQWITAILLIIDRLLANNCQVFNRDRAEVTKIFTLVGETNLPPSQEKVLEFLKLHPYEVFAVTEVEEIAQTLEMNKNNASWCFWALEKKHLIGKRRLGRKVYYGSLEAINQLDRELRKKGEQE